MNQELANNLLDMAANWLPWYAIAAARPAGFTLLFAMFAWGRLNSGMMRMAFAMALSLPVFVASINAGEFHRLAMPVIPTLIKEVFIGSLLGFFASLPFAIAVSGGAIIDFYRGSFQGNPDPNGGQMTAVTSLFALIALWLFAQMGGFWVVASIIYKSYELWPVHMTFPTFRPGSKAVMDMIEALALGALILAGPIILILFISDMVHLVSSKFGKQINVTHMAFSTKNLLLALLLPVFSLVVMRSIKADFPMLEQSLEWMKITLG